MKKIFLWIFCFFSLTIGVNAISIETNVVLKDCIDGDTAVFIINKEEVKVRFLAINAPEKDTDKYGNEASLFACNLLQNAKEITIEYDEKATKDKYDRTLAWVWVDKSLIEDVLVKEGYAEVAYIYDDYKYTDSLCLIQSNAIKNKKNIWADGKEEDYCAKVDVSKVINIIDYNLMISSNNYDAEDIKTAEENFKKTQDTLEKISNVTDNISSFLDNNTDQISNAFLYAFLGVAGLYVLIQTIKTLK